MERPIYLDYNATTPVDPRVLEAILPFLKEAYGNASSMSHAYGWEANQAVEKARKQAAQLIGCSPKNIYWTSGATESNNWAILGYLRPYLKRKEKCHLITSQIEHKAVLDVAQAIQNEGCEVTYVIPDKFGQISPQKIQEAIRPHTRLISIIMGQNEIGTINAISEIGRIAKDRHIALHTDAAQTVGKVAIDVEKMGVDLVSCSGHKIYATKGVGFLYVRNEKPRIELESLFYGGSQERGLRPGTLNVPAIVGLGAACGISQDEMASENKRLTEMRDGFIAEVLKAVPSARLNGHPTDRLCNNVSFSFEGLSSDVFALGLAGLAVSSGSACSTGSPSHVLSALGLPESLSRATVRFGFGRWTTPKDLQVATQKIIEMIRKNQSYLTT